MGKVKAKEESAERGSEESIYTACTAGKLKELLIRVAGTVSACTRAHTHTHTHTHIHTHAHTHTRTHTHIHIHTHTYT